MRSKRSALAACLSCKHVAPRRRLLVESLEPRQMMSADVVLQFNELMGHIQRVDATMPGPTFSSRNYAILHAAIYDAVNSIERTHTPYFVDHVAPAFASREAAVAAAAYTVLSELYPAQIAPITAAYQLTLDNIPDGAAEDAGVAVGTLVAAQLLEFRAGDHAFDPTDYAPKSLPGHWRPAPPLDSIMGLGAEWGHVTPFTLGSGDQFRPPAPPDMTSEAYTQSFNEVKSLGEKNSTTRTAEQTEIGIFWGYDRAGMGPPPILFNSIAREIAMAEGNTLAENARLFALHNMAQADAGIVAWDAKYVYDFWRPITAIREADTDGNPDTIADPDWEPLGAPGGGIVPDFTPPFPAYTSGHATFGAAFFGSLANFYGTDNYAFSVTSNELPGTVRHFQSFSQAAAENARSRIYLGVHWDFDDTLGQSTGFQVADFAFSQVLQPLDASPTIVAVGADAGGGPHVRIFDANNGQELFGLFAYDASFTGGVRVATGDVNGDGVDDIITGAGPGGGPHVHVFDGSTGAQIKGPLGSFFAFDAKFTGGIFVAAADLFGDAKEEVIVSKDAGEAVEVRIFTNQTGLASQLVGTINPYGNFGGGAHVATGDLDGDGVEEIITGAGRGGTPHVRAFKKSGEVATVSLPPSIRLQFTPTADFLAYSADFFGGVFVAAGDVDGDNRADIITGAGAGGGPHVRVISGASGAEITGLMAYAPEFTGGARVAAVDLDNDGRADIATAPGPGGIADVRLMDGHSGTLVSRFAAFGQFPIGAFITGAMSRGSTLKSSRGEAEVSIQAPEYTAAELQPLLAAAIERWGAAGIGDDLRTRLQQVRLEIVDLAGATLGSSYGSRIFIDHNAAGHGWFVDATPGDDREFTAVGDKLTGNPGTAAGEQFDLLTTILHELGHVLGLDHSGSAGDLMHGTLDAGARRLPNAAAVDEVFASL